MTLSQDLRRTSIVAALGTTQTLAWASSYYLVAILADAKRRFEYRHVRLVGGDEALNANGARVVCSAHHGAGACDDRRQFRKELIRKAQICMLSWTIPGTRP